MKHKQCQVTIPGFTIGNYIGGGANGDVYEAKDDLLQRKVAIKIWNERGESRAKSEISKIAKFQHELFVSTYQFGIIDGKQYAIMEFVDGVNGKEWIKENPSFNDKKKVWKSYSKALQRLYRAGEFHGDPHLGNVLIKYESENYEEPSIMVKLADTGTSLFWDSHKEFENRDLKLILETAHKIFDPNDLANLIKIPDNLSAVSVLKIVECYCNLYDFVINTEADGYAYGQYAAHISGMLVDSPYFDIDHVIGMCIKRGLTSERRIMLQLNKKLRLLNECYKPSDLDLNETKEEYLRLSNSLN